MEPGCTRRDLMVEAFSPRPPIARGVGLKKFLLCLDDIWSGLLHVLFLSLLAGCFLCIRLEKRLFPIVHAKICFLWRFLECFYIVLNDSFKVFFPLVGLYFRSFLLCNVNGYHSISWARNSFR